MRYAYAANSLRISHRNNYTTLKNPGFDRIQCYYAHENPSNINRIMDLKLQEHFKCLFFDTYENQIPWKCFCIIYYRSPGAPALGAH